MALLKNLNRPIPDLYVYLSEKILTWIWKGYFGKVGTGLHLSKGAKIRGGKFIVIGNNFQSGPNLWLEAVKWHNNVEYFPSISIGNIVRFSDNVHIACANRVTIGNGVLIGSNVHITDHSHGRYTGVFQDSPVSEPPVFRRLPSENIVQINDNVWLGDGVVVLPNVIIGKGSIIGANSVVSKDIPEYVIAVGSPAKPIKIYDFNQEKWIRI